MSTRRSERAGAAGLRAVSRIPTAELRGTRLEVDDRLVALMVPHLALETIRSLDPTPSPEWSGHDEYRQNYHQNQRGVMDALGLRLRHSDRSLHLELSPSEPLERIVFDIAEQFRCEALIDPTLVGVKANTTAAFDRWSERAVAERIDETGVGLAIFTITQMIRSRLLRVPTTELVGDVIESTRGNLSRLVGHALKNLPALIDSQRAYAEPAQEIARLIGEMVADASLALDAAPEAVDRHRLLLPVDWDLLNEELAEVETEQHSGLIESDYRIFSTAFDVEVAGADLYRPASLRQLRQQLDSQIADQAVSITRLAQKLKQLFPSFANDGWSTGQSEGVLDPQRLPQLVADPLNPHVRRLPRQRIATDSMVTFVVDTTGSMKLQRYETVAVLVDTLVRALELAEITTEVLGFSTASWAGGRSRQLWASQGSPADPGRLSETLHIVYKSAEQSWRQSRLSLAAMMRTDHYREGVDGEALLWAASRAAQRSEQRRVVVLISDGLPMEATTANANRENFLTDHLRTVASSFSAAIGQRRPSPNTRSLPFGDLSLGAITIDQALGEYIPNSVTMDLSGTLRVGDYDVLQTLFNH